jgi:hypothetical protein
VDQQLRPREYAMRLAFWRAGEDKPVVQWATARPSPSVPKHGATSESGDLDLHALGQTLMRKRRHRSPPST